MATKKILCLGDSTTMGYSSDSTDYKLNTWTTSLSNLLQNNGIVSSSENFFGCLYGYTYPNLDSRLTVPNSWVAEGGGYFGYYSLGGGLYQATNTTDSLIFKPRVSVDTIEIYSATRGGNLQITILDSSNNTINTLNIQNQTGTPFILKKDTISIPLTVGVSIYIRAQQTPAYLCGINAYKTGDLQILNAGVGGSTAQCWNDNSALTRAKSCIPILNPDIVIICLGINDYWHGFSDYIPGMTVNSFSSTLYEFVRSVSQGGRVILYTPNPTSAVSQTVQRNYCNAIINVAQSLKVECVDVNNSMTDYNTASNAGYVTSDGVHPSKSGYQFIAQQIYNKLITML